MFAAQTEPHEWKFRIECSSNQLIELEDAMRGISFSAENWWGSYPPVEQSHGATEDEVNNAPRVYLIRFVGSDAQVRRVLRNLAYQSRRQHSPVASRFFDSFGEQMREQGFPRRLSA